jgi:hypothetical protein
LGGMARLASDVVSTFMNRGGCGPASGLRAHTGLSIDTPAVLAIVAYVACVGAAVYVLLPHELVLEFRGSVVNELEYERGGGLDAAYEAVTEWLEEFHESNAGTLRGLGRWYTIACAALGAEVLLWTLSITDTL